MEPRFGYLLERIRTATFATEPFPHLYLTDFLADEDFKAVTCCRDVDLAPAADVDQLFSALAAARYEPISFPGCTTDRSEYIRWLDTASKPRKTHAACEGQGMAFRLGEPVDDTLRALNDVFTSPEMVTLLREKFEIERSTTIDAGIQKYLHGYEISPHPDIRRKALTWMLNINPGADSEGEEFHTHYMRMTPERSYVVELWKHNRDLDTCWVPWEWCSTIKQQRENNSIVIFSPRWDTIHGIKAHYDHLAAQRTQLYGNLWYEALDPPTLPVTPSHEQLDFTGAFQKDPSAWSRATRGVLERAHAVKKRVTR